MFQEKEKKNIFEKPNSEKQRLIDQIVVPMSILLVQNNKI